MRAQFASVAAIVVASTLATMTTASIAAERLSAQPKSTANGTLDELQQANTVRTNQTPTQADELHNDPRWSQFQNCINNTGSREAFEACLRRAYQTDDRAGVSPPASTR
jgi:hypothetical protein